MIREIEDTIRKLEEWKKDGDAGGLSGEEANRLKEFLLARCPIRYRELFPEDGRGIAIPGIEWTGRPPDACVGAAWHYARAEQFLAYYLDDAGVGEKERKRYRRLFMAFHHLAALQTGQSRREKETAGDPVPEKLERLILRAAEKGMELPLACRLAELAFRLEEQKTRIVTGR